MVVPSSQAAASIVLRLLLNVTAIAPPPFAGESNVAAATAFRRVALFANIKVPAFAARSDMIEPRAAHG